MGSEIVQAVRSLLALLLVTVLMIVGMCGVVYPLAMKAVAQNLLSQGAGDQVMASAWPMASSGSRLVPLSPPMADNVQRWVAAYQPADAGLVQLIPAGLAGAANGGTGLYAGLTALDQHAAAALEFGLSEATIGELLRVYTEGRWYGFIFEPVMDVLAAKL